MATNTKTNTNTNTTNNVTRASNVDVDNDQSQFGRENAVSLRSLSLNDRLDKGQGPNNSNNSRSETKKQDDGVDNKSVAQQFLDAQLQYQALQDSSASSTDKEHQQKVTQLCTRFLRLFKQVHQ